MLHVSKCGQWNKLITGRTLSECKGDIQNFTSDIILAADDSRLVLSQWETTLQCNVVSHWLNPMPGVAAVHLQPKFIHRASVKISIMIS